MKNVKIILAGVAICATLFANARINALGEDSGFWPGDRDNVNWFPATINDHGFVEIDGVDGDIDGTDVNASILWGDATKWGFSWNGTTVTDNDAEWFNLSWGNGDMGLNVGYLSKTDDVGSGDVSGFNVGYGQNFDWGELGVGFNSNEDDSDYWVNWRGDLDAWVFESAKVNFKMYDWDSGASSMSLTFDLFTHLDAGGADVLFGLGFDYETEENTSGKEQTEMTLPAAIVAVEAALTDWATLRAHVEHSWSFSCDSDANYSGGCTDGDSEGSGTSYGFGLGFDWGQVALDMEVNETLFTDPVTTITGAADGNTLASGGVTLSYTF